MANPPPPPTRFGPRQVGQPKPAAAAGQPRVHTPPPTRFGGGGTTQAKPALLALSVQPALRPGGSAAVPGKASPAPPPQRWQPRVIMRMEATKELSLPEIDLGFVRFTAGNQGSKPSKKGEVFFGYLARSKLACQTIAIAGVTGWNQDIVMEDLVETAEAVNADRVTTRISAINTVLDQAGFNVQEELADDGYEYEYANEAIILSYLHKSGFHEVTFQCIPGKAVGKKGGEVPGGSAKGMHVQTFLASAKPGRYVLMTPGHMIGAIVGTNLQVYDGDATNGGLATGSKSKPIMTVFAR